MLIIMMAIITTLLIVTLALFVYSIYLYLDARQTCKKFMADKERKPVKTRKPREKKYKVEVLDIK